MNLQLIIPSKTSYLSEHTTIEGTITSKEDLTINATIIGQVVGCASIIIEAQANIDGSVHSQQLVVKGTVKGTVQASDVLELLPKSHIHGNITAPQGALIIAEGSQIEGTCSMPAISLKQI